MKTHIISISDDDDESSEDELPLHLMKNGVAENPNSYSSLCAHSVEACEFCEKVFKNRYSSLVHNVKHIIIPLINQTVYQCEDCLYHFSSQKELRAHKFIKHHILMSPQILVKKDPIEFYPIKKEEPLDSIEYLKHEFVEPKRERSVEIIIDDEPENLDEPVEPLKNRLVFEDDIVILNCDRLLNDLTTDCQVSLEKPPWLDVECRSVHYDELIKPGVYRCKKCGQGFPMRYEAIKHETSHLSISNSQVTLCIICKEYILGNKNNLRLHYLAKHRQTPKTCYAADTDYITKKNIFDVEEQEAKKVERVNSMTYNKTLLLCELCFSFCKNKSFLHYECVGEVSELGKRFQCEKCGLKFFEIKLVKRQMKFRKAYIVHKKKVRSNEERLKTIQQRFKMMKMLKK